MITVSGATEIFTYEQWWIGTQVRCRVCGAVLELEAEDIPIVEETISIEKGTIGVRFRCPISYNWVSYERDAEEGELYPETLQTGTYGPSPP